MKFLEWFFFPTCLNVIPVQSVPITTKVVSLNHVHGEVYNIMW